MPDLDVILHVIEKETEEYVLKSRPHWKSLNVALEKVFQSNLKRIAKAKTWEEAYKIKRINAKIESLKFQLRNCPKCRDKVLDKYKEIKNRRVNYENQSKNKRHKR